MNEKNTLYVSALSQFLLPIYKKSPLQKKAIENFLRKQDVLYFERAETFAKKMLSFIHVHNLEIEYVIDAYLQMCKDMMIEQLKFQKTGCYSCKSAEDAMQYVYSSEKEMASYMYGLGLSQFLWPNHYGLFNFFIDQSKKNNKVNKYLEIGPGHGLFLAEAISLFPKAEIKAIDISPISARIARNIVDFFAPTKDCSIEVKNVIDIENDSYDYIVMCEVLEHLDNPKSILIKLRELLAEGGRLFITTCANGPAIDHVYLYTSVAHIRQELFDAGYNIISEIALPVGDFLEEDWEEKKVGINYAAMLERRQS